MPVQPIDLQTVLLRLSQIGKDQAAQQNASAHNQAALGDELARETQMHDRTVRETRTLEDGTDSVNEDGGGGSGRRSGGGSKGSEEEKKDDLWRDPELGQNVDISG